MITFSRPGNRNVALRRRMAKIDKGRPYLFNRAKSSFE